MANPCVIEINDIAVTLADAQGPRLNSASCALWQGNKLLVGDEARARARLNPRLTYDRFWSQLDQQPLHRPAGDANSHADLAWFHLKDLWDKAGAPDDEVIFAVPPDWEKPQLALLLGIAQACEIPAAGLIASPIAAAGGMAVQNNLLYLDAQWQRIRATRISGDSQLALGPSWEASKRGISAYHEQWANLIAQQFLHELRFDPMHQADSEQLLYNQLPDWLQKLHDHSSALLELEVGPRRYRLEMPRQALIGAASQDYASMAANARAAEPAQRLLNHCLAELPGLTQAFENEGLSTRVCPTDAVTQGVLGHFNRIRSDPEAPAFVTRLPRSRPGSDSAPSSAQAPAPAAEVPVPTHVLQGWRALALKDHKALREAGLTQAGVSLSFDQKGPLLEVAAEAAAQLNGRPLTGEHRPLAGDRLHFDRPNFEQSGQDWLFIVADTHHGPE